MASICSATCTTAVVGVTASRSAASWLRRRGCQLGRLHAQLLFLCAELGRKFAAEILGLEHLADLDFGLLAGHRIGTPARPVDRFAERLAAPQQESGDQLLGFEKRAVDDGPSAAGKFHPRAS